MINLYFYVLPIIIQSFFSFLCIHILFKNLEIDKKDENQNLNFDYAHNVF